jgi:uncharacterized protein (DUF1684 family)
MKRLAAALILLTACQGSESGSEPVAPQADAYRQSITDWQKRRVEGLKKDDSWLTLVGLHWLEEGEHRVGSAEGSGVMLPASAPPEAGTLVLRDGKATFAPAVEVRAGDKSTTEPFALLDDSAEDGPTIVSLGGIRFQLIRRGDRFALRVKDANAETRAKFTGLEYFPIDPKWRIEARLEAYHPPKNIPITDVTGMTSDNVTPWALVFEAGGREYRLDPIIEGDRFFVIFKDETSRDTTYEAGRYLYADRPKAGDRVVLDFNKAYNPPCVFTPFATCPLPPPQNRLPLRIEAGEKKYH